MSRRGSGEGHRFRRCVPAPHSPVRAAHRRSDHREASRNRALRPPPGSARMRRGPIFVRAFRQSGSKLASFRRVVRRTRVRLGIARRDHRRRLCRFFRGGGVSNLGRLIVEGLAPGVHFAAGNGDERRCVDTSGASECACSSRRPKPRNPPKSRPRSNTGAAESLIRNRIFSLANGQTTGTSANVSRFSTARIKSSPCASPVRSRNASSVSPGRGAFAPSAAMSTGSGGPKRPSLSSDHRNRDFVDGLVEGAGASKPIASAEPASAPSPRPGESRRARRPRPAPKERDMRRRRERRRGRSAN